MRLFVSRGGPGQNDEPGAGDEAIGRNRVGGAELPVIAVSRHRLAQQSSRHRPRQFHHLRIVEQRQRLPRYDRAFPQGAAFHRQPAIERPDQWQRQRAPADHVQPATGMFAHVLRHLPLGVEQRTLGRFIDRRNDRRAELFQVQRARIKLLADNEEKAIAYNGLGNAFRAVGDYDSAIKSFRKAAELDPYSAGLQNQTNVFKSEASVKSPTFWADLGTAFLDNCSFNEAITALNKAIELNSNDGQVLFKLGKAYSYSGRYKEAILAFSNSVELLQDDKEKANSLNHLGNAYRKLNDYDKAIESFRKAVVLSDEGVTLATRARFSLLSNCRAEKV